MGFSKGENMRHWGMAILLAVFLGRVLNAATEGAVRAE